MAIVEVRIDRSKPLREDSATGHNRWHTDLPAIARVRPGDELILETRDALDGQIGPRRRSRRSPPWTVTSFIR